MSRWLYAMRQMISVYFLGTLGRKYLSIISPSTGCVSSQECKVREADNDCQNRQISQVLDAHMCFNYYKDSTVHLWRRAALGRSLNKTLAYF